MSSSSTSLVTSASIAFLPMVPQRSLYLRFFATLPLSLSKSNLLVFLVHYHLLYTCTLLALQGSSNNADSNQSLSSQTFASILLKWIWVILEMELRQRCGIYFLFCTVFANLFLYCLAVLYFDICNLQNLVYTSLKERTTNIFR